MGFPVVTATTRSQRLLWSIGDQVLSSATNFVLTLAVARVVTPSVLGTFALLMAGLIVAMGVARALTSEVVAVRLATADPGYLRQRIRDALGVALVIGCVASFVAVSASAAVGAAGGDWRAPLAMAVFVPFVLVQDTTRFALVSQKRPAHAFASDLVWALVQLPATAALSVTGVHSLWTYVAAWGIAAALAAGVALRSIGCLPRISGAVRWLRENRDLGVPFVIEFAAGQGAYQIALFVVGGIAGLAATGAIRGAQVLFGPLVVLSSGLTLAAVPELSRFPRTDNRRLVRASVFCGAMLGLVSLALGLGLLALPSRMGHAVLGSTWSVARPLIVFVTLQKVAEGFGIGAFIGMRSRQFAIRTAALRVAVGLSSIAAAVVGAYVDGARGVMIGLVLLMPVATIAWWAQFALALRESSGQPGGGRLRGVRTTSHHAVRNAFERALRVESSAVAIGLLTIAVAFATGITVSHSSRIALVLIAGGLVVSGALVVGSHEVDLSLRRIGIQLFALGVLASTWNSVRFHGFPIGDFFFAAALLMLLPLLQSVRSRIALPTYLIVAAGALIIPALVLALNPPAASYMASRVTAAVAFNGYNIGAGAVSSNFGTLLKLEFAVVGLPLLAVVLLRSVRTVRLLAYIWAVSATVSASLAILHHIGLVALSSKISGYQGGGREAGLTVQPNHLALSCAIVIPVVMFAIGRSRRGAALGLPALAVLLVAVVLSRSRGGAVVAFVAIPLSAFAIPELRRFAGRLAFVASLAGVVGLAYVGNWLPGLVTQTRISSASGTASDAGRSLLAHQAAHDFRTHPFTGVGYSQLTQAHDIYLQLFASGGVLAFVAFLVFAAGSVRESARVHLPAAVGLARALGISMLLWLLGGVIENAITDRYLFIPSALLAALWFIGRQEPVTVPATLSLPDMPGSLAHRSLGPSGPTLIPQ